MASVTRNPGLASGVFSTGESSWTAIPITACNLSDNIYAVCNLVSDQRSGTLQIRTYGFSIPAGAKIDGIEVKLERSRTLAVGGATVKDYSAKIYLQTAAAQGSVSSDDRSKIVNWPALDTIVTYGSPTDKWGLDAYLNPTWVNASLFAFRLKVYESSGGTSIRARVDHAPITIYYTLTDTTGTKKASLKQILMGT